MNVTEYPGADRDPDVLREPTARAFSDALGAALVPSESGEVIFGANNEPLRLSQVEGLTAVRDAVEEEKRIGHIVQPGGTGKTREAIVTAMAMAMTGRRTLYVVPSQQAVHDFAAEAKCLCPSLDVGRVYQVEKRIGTLTFITYASLLRCILGKEVEAEAAAFEEQVESAPVQPSEKVSINPDNHDLVIWDEAHMYLTKHAQQLLERFRKAINVGYTATPRYYEGKEVEGVFGEPLHELTLQTAVERKEISDFRNVLITTNVVTGLDLSSPEQEESALVAKAIDLPGRNRIFPDIYRRATIEVNGVNHTLVGEPSIIFGAGIQHVHDLAKEMNDALMPALKEDEEFRALLRSKGIDPDAVERIAEPIHSGGTDDHEPMSLEARNRLLARYHQRKVLTLTSTSVLQQSFDSPITSVVIDTVPRQTYVGVGQAGMRALRFLEGKNMAFIINVQDADHPSLSFLDFQAVRGHEEGVRIEMRGKKSGHYVPRGPKHPNKKMKKTTRYKFTYGMSLVDLAERRAAHAHEIYRHDHDASGRSLTQFGFRTVNRLIAEIAARNSASVGRFMDVVATWVDRMTQRTLKSEFANLTLDPEDLEAVQFAALTKSMEKIGEGKVQNWSAFTVACNHELRRKIKKCAERNERRPQFVSLDDAVDIVDPADHWSDDCFEHDDRVFGDTLPRIDSYSNPELECVKQQLRKSIDRVLKTLSYREREVIRLRYGLGDRKESTLQEVGEIFEVSGNQIRMVEAKAIRKMQQPVRSAELAEFDDGWVAATDRAAERKEQERINNTLMWELEPTMMVKKEEIGKILTFQHGSGYLDHYPEIRDILSALTDLEYTRVGHLHRALQQVSTDALAISFTRGGFSSNLVQSIFAEIHQLSELMDQFVLKGGKPDCSS